MTNYTIGDYATFGLFGAGAGASLGTVVYYASLIVTGFQEAHASSSLEVMTNPILLGGAAVGGIVGVLKANSNLKGENE